MSKTRNWPHRAMYMLVALALVVGMAVVPATPAIAKEDVLPYFAQPEYSIAYNIKGATHKVVIDLGDWEEAWDNGGNVTIDWWLEAGVALTPGDVTVIDPTGPNPYEDDKPYGETIKAKGLVDNVLGIELRSMKVGDIHIFAEITNEELNETITLHTEKKWGRLAHTDLDVDPDTSGVRHTTTVQLPGPGATGNWTYSVKDMIQAEFLEVPGTVPVTGAVVHWWLLEESEANQDWVDAMMDYIVTQDGAHREDPPTYWSATGKYKITDPFLDGNHPWQFINDWVTAPDDTKHVDPAVLAWSGFTGDPSAIADHPDTDVWYGWSTSENGLAAANFTVNMDELDEHEVPDDVMVVVLVSYPSGTTPQHDPFHGENPICLEKGKISFTRVPYVPPPEITAVKTPQVRWAGEKIVLEKDWGEEYAGNWTVYNLEQGNLGNLESIDGESQSAQQVWTQVDEYGISRVILASEKQGKADVNVALYDQKDTGTPILNHGFMVFFLAFEDIVIADETPPSSIQELEPGDDAHVAVQVRGWFTSDALPGTLREPLVSDDGITLLAPAGRYVLPDDWAALAGYNYALRPNWDLMNQPGEGITSDDPLGAYNEAVWTTEDPGKAEYPTIGPFSTLQQWSTEDMWIASAETVPTSLENEYWRNTVVPDGVIDRWDAPMPQALIIFDVVSEEGTLSELPKTDLEGYGFTWDGDDKVYHSPYYAVEIPASPFIPPGYNYNSWFEEEPYCFWTDLNLQSIGSNTKQYPPNPRNVHVYSDNHGIAAVAIDALDDEGYVTITATAEYPFAPKKGQYPPIVSDDIIATWGEVSVDDEPLNPHFTADKTEVEVGDIVTFTNETTLGTQPFVRAQWDFDGNGVIDIDIEGTHAEVMVPVQWEYDAPGLYNVALTMTDQLETRTEIRHYYITVLGDPDDNDNDFVNNPPIEEGLASIADDLVIVLLWHPATQTWDLYFPLTGDDTIGTLEAGRAYWIYVDADCTLEYGTVSIPLYAGWNNPVWPAQ